MIISRQNAATSPLTPRALSREVEGRGRGRGAVRATALAFVLAASATALPAAAQNGGAAGDAAHGEELFYEHACYSCHGFKGVGRTPLDTSRSAILASAEGFTYFLRLRAEQNPILPSSAMPNYPEESLSDADAQDLYAYILSVQAPSPAVEDIPVFQAILEDAAGD